MLGDSSGSDVSIDFSWKARQATKDTKIKSLFFMNEFSQLD
jgi:hypothetical protein